MSSPREREKRDRRENRGDEREGQGRKRNRNESEETEEIKTFPLYHYPLQGEQALPNCKPISVGRPSDVRYTAPSHHPTTPDKQLLCNIFPILSFQLMKRSSFEQFLVLRRRMCFVITFLPPCFSDGDIENCEFEHIQRNC